MSAPTRDEAWRLFCEWTESDSLRRHVLGVEAAMRAYAGKYGEGEELWAVAGILHGLDYERYPDPNEVRQGAEALGEDFDAHIAFVIAALEPHAEELGLTGS